MEVAGSKSFDRLVVNGNASLAGTLEVIPLGYQFSYGQKLVGFLQAGSVTGAFDTILMPPGFRGRVLEDDGTLTLLAAPQSYTLVAKSANQERVAAALDGFIPATSGDRQVVSIALDELTENQFPNAFEQIMPSIYQSVAYLSIDLVNDIAQVVDQRIGAIRLGARGLSVQGLGNVAVYNTDKAGASKSVVDSKKDIIRQEPDNKWGVWVVGNGVFARNYALSDVPNARFNSGGFVVGMDYHWNETWSTGLFAGYQGGYASYPNNGSMNMNGTTLAVT
jgi:uncharacterized protein with beta-barrel porin domain